MIAPKAGIGKIPQIVCMQQGGISAGEQQHVEHKKMYLEQQRELHKLKGACRDHAIAVESSVTTTDGSDRLLRDGCDRTANDPIGFPGLGFQRCISDAVGMVLSAMLTPQSYVAMRHASESTLVGSRSLCAVGVSMLSFAALSSSRSRLRSRCRLLTASNL